ncbi:MAG: hypothetical protein AAF429_14890, partial [Pseudomonadota bacterium]
KKKVQASVARCLRTPPSAAKAAPKTATQFLASRQVQKIGTYQAQKSGHGFLDRDNTGSNILKKVQASVARCLRTPPSAA